MALKWRLRLLVVVHGAQRLLTSMALLHSLFLASSYHYEVLPVLSSQSSLVTMAR